MCNNIELTFTVSPSYAFLDQVEYVGVVLVSSPALANPKHQYAQQTLTLSYDFSQDINGEIIGLSHNSTLLPSNYTFYFAPNYFQVTPHNNVAASYIDPPIC